MDRSQQGNRGCHNEAPTAAQLQAFADGQTVVAGQKRAANEVSDLEIPEGSRPMLGLDRTRHRPNHPRNDIQQQLSSDPGTSSSLSTSNATESPVPHQHVDPPSAPLLSSPPAVAEQSPSDVVDSIVLEPSAAVTLSPASSNSRPIDSFADGQNIVAGQKRAANEVSDLEIPEGSRPMLGLNRTRHRPNHPKSDSQQQWSSDPVTSSSLSTINATASPVPLQHVDSSSTPLLSSPPAVAEESPSNVMDSAVLEPSAAATISPASSNSRPIDTLSGLDQRSPAVQSMLREAFNEGRAEGRRENGVKLDEAEAKVEELRKRLDPSKLKAAYDRGMRDGGIAGYNKYSLSPETKPSDDRLAFENICKEKDKAIHDQQVTMAEYQKELMARKRRIQILEQQANLGSPQPPNQQQGQNITGQQISDAEARFSAQGQELEATRAQNELMRADLANWQVQWGLLTADLEKWKAAFSDKAGQLDACQRQLGQTNGELQESIAKASELAMTNSVKTGSLEAATEELESKLNVLSFDFNSLDRLYTTLVQVAAERSAEDQSVIEDGKDVNNALTSNNNELTELREQLEKKVGRQAEEIERFSEENEELKQRLKEREEEDAKAPRNRQNSPSQAIDQTPGEIDALPTNMAQETAAANVELVREVLERERRAIEAENLRRENRVSATLEEMRETERGRRQVLIDELEDKDAQLYNAQTQIRELTERLLAASPTQPSPTPQSATSSSSSSHPPPAPETSSSPPPPETPPSPAEHTPPTIPTSSTAQPQPSVRRSHIPATNNFSPRRLFIMLAILLLAFLLPFLRFPSRPASEDINSRQVAIAVLPEVEVVSRRVDYEDRGRQWQAWAMGNWERNERIERGEVVSDEYRPIGGWEY